MSRSAVQTDERLLECLSAFAAHVLSAGRPTAVPFAIARHSEDPRCLSARISDRLRTHNSLDFPRGLCFQSQWKSECKWKCECEWDSPSRGCRAQRCERDQHFQVRCLFRTPFRSRSRSGHFALRSRSLTEPESEFPSEFQCRTGQSRFPVTRNAPVGH